MPEKKQVVIFIPAVLLAISLLFTFSENIPYYTKLDNGIVIRLKNPGESETRLLKLQVITENIIRVTASPSDGFAPDTSLMVIRNSKPSFRWDVKESKGIITLSTPEIHVIVDPEGGRLSFTDTKGTPLLNEIKAGRIFSPFLLEGETSYVIQQRFESPGDEGIYGLGQHQSGIINYKNHHVDLTQNNTEVAIPFLISGRNYGVLWDNYSITKVGDSREYQELNRLKLFSASGEQGWLTATYAKKTDSSVIFTQRPESVINYEFIPLLKNFPAGVKLANSIVRWEGSMVSGFTGTHHFMVKYGGYINVFIDGKLQCERWRQSWNPGTVEIPIHLEKGKKHSIRIEWNPDGGESYIAVRWLSPLNAEQQREYSFKSESGAQVDYYFIHGKNLDEVIAGYRKITGAAPIMPKWAMGFWQSRERYKTQKELTDVVKEFRQRRIPLDNIVLDWSYWEEDKWGSQDFDLERFPDAEAMINTLHKDYNTQIMISVWPKFYEGISTYDTFNNKDWLFKRNIANRQRDWIGKGYVSSFYDAFNADARKAFWELIREKLYNKGIDAWWMDATEPDILSNSSVDDRKLLMTPNAAGASTTYFNAFPLQNAKGIYEGQRETNPDKRVFILTRSAYAGMQRYAAATWSGDIASRWHDFKDQIPAGINFSLSGLPYWTMDIGGFAVERRFENAKGETLEEWRELNARWFQYGAFCPIFRSHGQYPFREIFHIAPENHPAYKTMLYYNKLRYRLMPYIYSLAGKTYHNHYTIMRGLMMDFGADKQVASIGNQFMFGDALMVNPVTDYKATTRTVYFPEGTGWYNFYNGDFTEGGRNREVPAPLDIMPLYVKEGSIIPFGPELQYSSEKPADPLTLYVYAGKDGKFELYEDEGLNYNYEKGKFSVIPLIYNEKSKTITIESRRGSFAGMLEKRVVHIVYVTRSQPKGFDPEKKGDRSIEYTGKKVVIKLI